MWIPTTLVTDQRKPFRWIPLWHLDGLVFGSFFLYRTQMERKIRILGIPEPTEKIVKGTYTGSIPKFKTAEDSIKRINLQLGSPVS